MTETDIHTNELWFYSYTNNAWSLKAMNSSVIPPALTGHTMTLVDSQWLYVIGGKLPSGFYSSKMFRFNIRESGQQWEQVVPTGGRQILNLVVGHSAVYHNESRSILIFGGYVAYQAKFAKISKDLSLFSVDTHYWTEVMYGDPDEISIAKRAYHTAVIMGNYMVVYGGNVHEHSVEEICYDNKIHLYHLGCHEWVNHKLVENLFAEFGE